MNAALDFNNLKVYKIVNNDFIEIATTLMGNTICFDTMKDSIYHISDSDNTYI